MFKTLLKVNLRAMFSTMFARLNKRKTGKKAGRIVLIALLALYVVGMLMFSIGSIFFSLAEQFSASPDGAWLYFALLGILIFCFAFIGSVFSTKNLLFRAKDNELLLSMPIPPFRILGSRVAVLLVLETLYALLMTIPAAIVWFLRAGFSAPLLLRLVLCTLLMILFAAAVTGFFGWLLALLDTKFAKSNMVQTALSFVLLIGYMFLCFNMQNYISVLLNKQTQIADAVRRVLPLFYCYGRGVSGSAGSILLLILIACVPFLLICLLLSRSFLKLSTDKQAVRRSRRASVQKSAVSPTAALVRKELRKFFSTPMYLLNCGLGALMQLLLAMLIIFNRNALDLMVSQIPIPGLLSLIPLIPNALCLVTLNSCAISLSLEGKRINQLRAMPLNAAAVFHAKLAANILIGLPTTVISCAVIGAMLTLPLHIILLSILFCVADLVLISCIHLTCNITMPKFNFLNEAVLIKQSGSVLVGMLLTFVANLTLIGACLGLCYLFDEIPAILCVTVLALLGICLFLRYFSHGAARRYNDMCA